MKYIGIDNAKTKTKVKKKAGCAKSMVGLRKQISWVRQSNQLNKPLNSWLYQTTSRDETT
jgi:hypothetical protein